MCNFQSYCGEPDEFPNYDLSRTEAECPEDFEHDLTKCMTQFTKKYIYIKADASELCQWVFWKYSSSEFSFIYMRFWSKLSDMIYKTRVKCLTRLESLCCLILIDKGLSIYVKYSNICPQSSDTHIRL